MIVYGKTPTVVTHFRNVLPSPDLLKRRIDATPRASDGAALDQALGEAKKVFEQYSTRPQAKKILVVITDNESGVSKDNIR